ncbi:MAG: hypothetical protein RR572_03645 [Raoultibacter sp.]
MIISDFVDAMTAKDHVALANCFTDTCRLFDYCPQGVGLENSYIYGKRAIDMFYHNKFVLGGFSMLDPRIIDERMLNFYANYNGVIIHAIATIENCNGESCSLDNSLIQEMVIRPA